MNKYLILTILLLPSIYFFTMNREDESQSTSSYKTIESKSERPKVLEKKIEPSSPKKLKKALVNLKEEQKQEKENHHQRVVNPQEYFYQKRNESIPFVVKEGKAIIYGDVVLGEVSKDFTGSQGFIDIPQFELWETSKIPYVIDPSVPNRELVLKAIDDFNEKSIVQFVPFDGKGKDAVVFTKGKEHCYSFLGHVGGAQPIYLSKECGVQEIMHEMMHAIGFFHEQSRTDRDDYVKILWENIEEKYAFNFSYVPDSLMPVLSNTPFDFSSIMLYRKEAFAKKGKNSIRPVNSGNEIKPVIEGLSEMDLERIRYLYGGK